MTLEIKDVEEVFLDVFSSEVRKNPYFHFGYKQWDDIQLEIFEHVCEKIPTFNHSLSLRPWLRRVVKNQVINSKRNNSFNNLKESRSFTLSDKYYEFIAELNNDPINGKLDDAECLEGISDSIKSVWSRMSFKSKRICIMSFKRKMSPQEIGERVHLSRRQVWNRIKGIRAEILKEFKLRGIHTRSQTIYNENGQKRKQKI